jgi:osmotically-inducible protein OsmY
MRDEILQREVLDELKWEPSVNPAAIGVAVTDGVVTLTGYVDTYAEKLAAEKAAKRVKGVRAVAEEIEVKVSTLTERTDTDIAKAALNALQWNVQVPEEKIKVKVEDGWVILEGQVEWGFQKEAALDAVRYLTGVRGVSNLITIAPKIATYEIKDKIRDAFKRSAELDADRIRIDAADGKVTLSGKVHSWLEHDEAGRVAWAAPGVTTVVNQLAVSP